MSHARTGQRLSCQQTPDNSWATVCCRASSSSSTACDWSVAVGVSAFRAELSGDARVGEETVASVKKTSTVTAQGSNGPPSGSRDALHAHQHADPTGVYPASVNDSCHACWRTHARVGRPGEWLIDWFIYLATQRCSYLRSVRMSTCSLQLCSGLKYSAWWKQQTVKTTSGARSVRMSVCCFFSSLPWCTELKTHVAQLSASSCACSFSCLHDWSKLIL